MNLFDITQQYEEGSILKNEFVEMMYERHNILFEYADYLKNVCTGIKKIEISDGQVIFTTLANDIQMICDPCDKRSVPIKMFNFGPSEEDDFKIINKIMGSDNPVRQLDKNNHPKHSVLLPPRPSILPESSQVKYFSARITITG